MDAGVGSSKNRPNQSVRGIHESTKDTPEFPQAEQFTIPKIVTCWQDLVEPSSRRRCVRSGWDRIAYQQQEGKERMPQKQGYFTQRPFSIWDVHS